ncbi:hypothetical protein POX43_24215, partial [Escherichia coli]
NYFVRPHQRQKTLLNVSFRSTERQTPNSEVNFYMGNLAHNNLDTGTTGHRVSFKCCDPVSLLILKDRKRIKA